MTKKLTHLLSAALLAAPLSIGAAAISATPAHASCTAVGYSGSFTTLTNQCNQPIAIRWNANGRTSIIMNLGPGRQSQIPVVAMDRNSVSFNECWAKDYRAQTCGL